MKKVAIALATALLIVSVNLLSAQDNKRADRSEMSIEQKAKEKTDHMTKALELSKKQSKNLYKINLTHVQKMKSLKESMPKRSKEDHRNKGEVRSKHREAFLNDIRPILTAEQVKILDNHKNDRSAKDGKRPERTEESKALRMEQKGKREQMKKEGHKPEMKAEIITERLSTLLNLSPDQQKQIAAISMQHSERNAAMRDERKVSREQAKSQFKAERKAYEDAVIRILDNDQIEAFKAMIAKRESKKSEGKKPQGRR